MTKVKIIGEAIPNMPWQDRKEDCNDPVWRYDNNPVIGRNCGKGIARLFNSSVIPYNGKFVGLFRAEEKSGKFFVRYGESEDGLNFVIDDEKIKIVNEDGSLFENTDKKGPPLYQYDPRLVKIDDEYFGIWCENFPYAIKYPSLTVCKTKDFKTFTHMDCPLLPAQRNGVLFPRKINGEYKLLSRPSDLGHTPFGDIFISSSKDFEYWGKHKCVLQTQQCGAWADCKIGAGPAPIETSEGWLLFYHGVQSPCNGFVYSFGACILDIDDPTKVLYNCEEFLMTPEKDYETKGFVDNVVFPCSTLCDSETGRIAIYYGCADTVTSLAFAEIDELVDYIVAKKLGVKETIIDGVGGTRIAKQNKPSAIASYDKYFLERLSLHNEKVDYTIVFGGVNDFGQGDAIFGEYGDTKEGTFCGGVYLLCKMLKEKYGNNVMFILPLHMIYEYDEKGNLNPNATTGKYLRDYGLIIQQTAENFGFKVLDLWNDELLNPNIKENEKYFGDGLHPTDLGHSIIADRVINFIKSI